MWYGYMGFPFFPLIGIVFWVFIFFLVFGFLGRRHFRDRDNWHEGKSPEEILKERFAKGEIDEKEYKQRLDILKKS